MDVAMGEPGGNGQGGMECSSYESHGKGARGGPALNNFAEGEQPRGLLWGLAL